MHLTLIIVRVMFLAEADINGGSTDFVNLDVCGVYNTLQPLYQVKLIPYLSGVHTVCNV